MIEMPSVMEWRPRPSFSVTGPQKLLLPDPQLKGSPEEQQNLTTEAENVL